MKQLSLGAHLYIVLVLIFTAFLVVKSNRLLPTQHAPNSSDEEGVSNIDHGQDKSHYFKRESRKEEEEEGAVGMEQYPTGSSIPDCSHACGACFPCKRVVISFKCSTSIESCPIVYRCMCKGKYYHVPSN
ncbi:protein EPIDERMAL PATTERNING FACTOR 2-like [Tripterygium wilfordii]|uniref:Epidermal patterning factor-like protein n=1 Tax=Tripterygium wilfordii TaxID=458696 RepID=A0A7J7DT66_TRIWF|nr:protein EPIDERMAL PATTERNING FACTOR 2-like [Tripterygium wilfordii]KAF5749326.1 protein EPIDERMAL PATTERNING FACTOR 2-like [Tripterygium wilfordii]